jgi:hypothetical protein
LDRGKLRAMLNQTVRMTTAFSTFAQARFTGSLLTLKIASQARFPAILSQIRPEFQFSACLSRLSPILGVTPPVAILWEPLPAYAAGCDSLGAFANESRCN